VPAIKFRIQLHSNSQTCRAVVLGKCSESEVKS